LSTPGDADVVSIKCGIEKSRDEIGPVHIAVIVKIGIQVGISKHDTWLRTEHKAVECGLASVFKEVNGTLTFKENRKVLREDIGKIVVGFTHVETGFSSGRFVEIDIGFFLIESAQFEIRMVPGILEMILFIHHHIEGFVAAGDLSFVQIGHVPFVTGRKDTVLGKGGNMNADTVVVFVYAAQFRQVVPIGIVFGEPSVEPEAVEVLDQFGLAVSGRRDGIGIRLFTGEEQGRQQKHQKDSTQGTGGKTGHSRIVNKGKRIGFQTEFK